MIEGRNLNTQIEVSILRVVKGNETLRKENGKERNLGEEEYNNFVEVEYVNGVYKVLANNYILEESIKRSDKKIKIIIKSEISKVLNHLIYRTQKERMNPIEIAFLFEEIKAITNSNQKSLAELIGKTQGNISNKTRLLQLPLFLQVELIKNKLTERHGRAFLQLTNNKDQLTAMQAIYKEVVLKNLNVGQTEILINKALGKKLKEKNEKVLEVTNLRDLRVKAAIPVINQITGDIEKSLELIEKYNPELEIKLEKGISEKDYVININIKNIN